MVFSLNRRPVGSFADCNVSLFCIQSFSKLLQPKLSPISIIMKADQEIKIVNFADDTNFFWGDINSFTRLKPILILYEKASKINFSEIPGFISY